MNLNCSQILFNSDRLLVLKWKTEGIKQVEIAISNPRNPNMVGNLCYATGIK